MDFKELLAFQKGFQLAMGIFKISKSFPKEERYALTDQVRRSSRSVCACIAEAYRIILHISFQSSATLTWKIAKRKSGWILPLHVNI